MGAVNLSYILPVDIHLQLLAAQVKFGLFLYEIQVLPHAKQADLPEVAACLGIDKYAYIFSILNQLLTSFRQSTCNFW